VPVRTVIVAERALPGIAEMAVVAHPRIAVGIPWMPRTSRGTVSTPVAVVVGTT
jgi:hypothetical protein